MSFIHGVTLCGMLCTSLSASAQYTGKSKKLDDFAVFEWDNLTNDQVSCVSSAYDFNYVITGKGDDLEIWPNDRRSPVSIPDQLQSLYQKYNSGKNLTLPAYGGSIFKVSKGWLVAQDHGEFGGALHYYPTQGRPKRVYHKNTTGFFQWGGKLYSFGGLNHMAFNDGFVAQLRYNDETDDWKMVSQTHIPHSITSVIPRTDTEVLLITSGGPISLKKDGWMRFEGLPEQWEWLAPSHVTLLDEKIYISMRHFIGKLDLRENSSRIELLAPKNCYAFRPVKHERCDCIPLSHSKSLFH